MITGRMSETQTALIDVIIPAWNEKDSIARVIADIPKDFVNEIVVVDNNSSDATSQVARRAGATVLTEKRQGYGYACLLGMDYLKSKPEPPDILVFLDGDYSDYPEETPDVVRPIIEDDYDMVIGSRLRGRREKGAMLFHQVFGNWLSTRLLRLLYGVEFTDLGPFRAVKFPKLLELNMEEKKYGWTVEMQLKAAKHGLKTCEVPVRYRKRIGTSKVSGTIRGTVGAGYKILATLFKYR